MSPLAALPPLAALLLAPLLPALVTRTRCRLTGRRGPPLLQGYADLRKLLAKGAVYSRTTTAVFRAGPLVGLATVATAAAIVPLGGAPAPLAFPGDLVLLCGLLALMRFGTVLAALDTGSAFEGMGASREVQFAALAEPALVLALAVLVRSTGSLSLGGALAALTPATWAHAGAALVLVLGTLFVVHLAENARVPVDDPNTHLELTMIHEVMVLDHGGPDFALVQYAAALKLWVLGALLVGVALPASAFAPWAGPPVALAGMLALAVLVGVIETVMARLKLVQVPQLLVGAAALAVLAAVLGMRG
jgi:formate hydrogenlyase subunit 4